jgi:hypothetical protein
MYVTLRQLRLRDTNIDHVIGRITTQVLPLLAKIKGFRSYRIVDFRDGSYGSISTYDTEQGASEANRVAIDAAGVVLSDVLELGPIRVWKTLLRADANGVQRE